MELIEHFEFVSLWLLLSLSNFQVIVSEIIMKSLQLLWNPYNPYNSRTHKLKLYFQIFNLKSLIIKQMIKLVNKPSLDTWTISKKQMHKYHSLNIILIYPHFLEWQYINKYDKICKFTGWLFATSVFLKMICSRCPWKNYLNHSCFSVF